MADQFENQLPQKSDAKWVRALDASGNPILISKEDLASVVGGLIGANFIERNDIIDANTEFTGYCRLYSGKNAPGGGQGILISIFTGSCTAQFYFFYWPKAFYVRLKWDTWGEWTHVASIKG